MQPEDEGSPRRWLVALVVALGLALHLPMVRSGFYADDHVLLAMLRPESPFEDVHAWNLYDFRSPAEWAVDRASEAAFPIWTPPEWRIRFFHPLSGLSLGLDRALFGERPLAFHLVSLLLYAVALVLAHRLYLALGLSRGAALLGLLLFALGDATVLPVGWIANRNSVLVVLCGVAACLVAARAPGVPRGPRLLAALTLALAAALAKESGAAVFAALGALVLLRAAGLEGAERRRSRVLALALFLAPLVWAGGLAAAGYGTRNVFYATPWDAPLRFAERLLQIATLGALSLTGPVPVDFFTTFAPRAARPATLVALVLVVPLAVWILRRTRGRPGAGFLAAWCVLLLLPQAGAPVSDRTLFAASVGSAGLLALFFESLLLARRRGEATRAERVLGAVLLLSATVGSTGMLLLFGSVMADMAPEMRRRALAADVGSPADGPREALVLQADGAFDAFTLAGTRAFETSDRGVAFHYLQYGRRGVLLERTAPDVFELESLDEPFLTNVFERVYCVDDEAPSVGTTWRRSFLAAEVLAVDDGGVRRLRVALDRALDDSSVLLLAPVDGVLHRVAPPAVGASLRLETVVPANPLFP